MPRDHLGPLDPRFPVSRDGPCPVFWQALRPWQAHLHAFGSAAAGRFFDAESRRAVRQAARHEEVFVLARPQLTEAELDVLRERFKAAMRTEQPRFLDDDLPAVTFARVPYPELEGAALAREFALTGPLELGPERSA
jgi:hypothetical protein